MITKVTSPRTQIIKNFYGKAAWMKVYFDDLIRKLKRKKKIQ